MNETIEVPTDVLFDHAMTLAMEDTGTYNSFVDDEVEFALSSITSFDECDTTWEDGTFTIVFQCEAEGSVSKRVARATRWNPAEYETESVPIHVELHYRPQANGGFGGVDVEIEGGHNPFKPTHGEYHKEI